MAPRPGLTATVSLPVTDADTATAFRSGDVDVLATPRLVALAEEASVLAVSGALEKGVTTVGYRVQFDHLAPTLPGATVHAEATLEAVEGRRLIFRVSITDQRGLVAAGRITRVSVERDRFMEKARSGD